MEVLGLGLSIVSTAELCFKYGQRLIDLYQTFKGADLGFDERIIRVEHLWLKICTQLNVVKKLEGELSDEHRASNTRILQVLVAKLSAVCIKLDALLKKHESQSGGTGESSVRRLKYTFMKPQLDETIEDLQTWQEMYDPSWYLILRNGSHFIDDALPTGKGGGDSTMTQAASMRDAIKPHPSKAVSIFLRSDGLDQARSEQIPFSTTKFCPRSGSAKWIIIDTIPFVGTDINITTKDVRKLGTKLKNVDPSTFNILRCRGVVKIHDAARIVQGFDVILDLPVESSRLPHSLRSLLVSHHNHSLSDRFNVARQMAKATSYVHTLGFVHKSIRPENMIGFDDHPSTLGQFYLIGFEQVRSADGRTIRHGDLDASKDIYRHPERQGLHPHQDYRMQHDIYSLGVCLLEIGLWTSFVAYEKPDSPEVNAATLQSDGEKLGSLHGNDLKDRFVSLAKTELSKRMGTVFSNIVVNCLTCLDPTNDDFGDQGEFEDEDGVLIGVRYIEKILSKLSSFSI